MAVKYDKILGEEREKDKIPQLSADPSSPLAEDAWVLATIGGGAGVGEAVGLLLTLTQPGAGGNTYTFKYRTKEGTTVAVALT